jgi:simple sugar transport system permease protein
MTQHLTEATPQASPPPVMAARRNNVIARMALISLVGLIIASIARLISGHDEITSAIAMGGAINAAMPIMLAGLGGLWAERAGVVNIGLEGQMILGTWFAADFAWKSGSPWMLIVGGIVGGLIGGVLHAIMTVGFGVDQIISGVAINLLAPGVAKYLSGLVFADAAGQAAGGGPTQSPKVNVFSTFNWHAADDWLGKVNGHHWFLISDIAGLLDGIVSSLNWMTIIALLLVPVTWFVLWRTTFGLRLRSVGENPTSAETLGVKVYTMKAVGVVISGVLAGLAGAFIVDYGAGIYHDGQTNGRGYIGLAAMIFGNWRPGGLLAGASLFGYTDALQQQQTTQVVHTLLLVVAIVLVVAGAFLAYQRRHWQAVAAVVLGGLIWLWYATTSDIPSQFATYSPQILTLLVLAIASQRLRPPAADGIPWRRGQGA